MILSAQSIREQGLVEPLHARHRNSRGLSVGLGPAGVDLTARLPDGHLVLSPGDFVLLSCSEHMSLLSAVLGRVTDKSSWMRRGVTVHNTVIEPGWRGYLTVEVAHNGTDPVVIFDGDPITQVLFEWLDYPTDRPYDGPYQDQQPGPQPSVLSRR